MNVAKHVVRAAALLGLVLAVPCSAADSPLVRGTVELAPKVAFSHSNLKREGYGNVDNSTHFEFTPTIGFCVTDRVEVTGGVSIRHDSVNGTGSTALGAIAGFLYNFRSQGTMVPFAGLGFGTLFNDGFTFNSTSVLAPAITGGMRVMVGGRSAVNFSLGYEHETDGHVSENRLLGSVGVSIFPWSFR